MMRMLSFDMLRLDRIISGRPFNRWIETIKSKVLQGINGTEYIMCLLTKEHIYLIRISFYVIIIANGFHLTLNHNALVVRVGEFKATPKQTDFFLSSGG